MSRISCHYRLIRSSGHHCPESAVVDESFLAPVQEDIFLVVDQSAPRLIVAALGQIFFQQFGNPMVIHIVFFSWIFRLLADQFPDFIYLCQVTG